MPAQRNNKGKNPKKKKPVAKPPQRKSRAPSDKAIETALGVVIPWLTGHGFWHGLIALVVLIFAWKIASHYFP